MTKSSMPASRSFAPMHSPPGPAPMITMVTLSCMGQACIFPPGSRHRDGGVTVRPVQTHVVILGAGFGGLELATRLSDAVGDTVHVTLIDKSDAFMFGFSKLDVMFGR